MIEQAATAGAFIPGDGRCTVGLPFCQWPDTDRALWAIMFPDDVDDRNERFAGAPPTDRSIGNIRQLLCRIAGFHARVMPWLLEKPFPDRFGEDAVALLVDDLADTCCNETIRAYLKDLARYIRRCGGTVNPWFDRILRDLARNMAAGHRVGLAISTRDIAERAGAYLTAALANLETDAGVTRAYNAPERFRNGYIIYLINKRPLRLLNMSQLVLGETFRTGPDHFELRFPGGMMKNGDPYSSLIRPDGAELFDWTRRYVDRVLPLFGEGDGLFKSRQGGRLTPIGLYQIITSVTQELLGIRLSPHDFRRIFTDSAVANGKSLEDINHACQRRPGSQTIYDYKTVLSTNAKRVGRPMFETNLSALLNKSHS